jgi:deoxyhypusine synthase
MKVLKYDMKTKFDRKKRMKTEQIYKRNLLLIMELPIVKDMKLFKGMNLNSLAKEMMKSGGFTAKKIGIGVNILEQMIEDKNSINFLSFPACIIATGTRGIIKEIVKRKLIDAIITTCGTLDHDLARVWKNYYHGSFELNDKELHKKGINRIGNILVPNESYGLILENKMQPILKELWEEKNEWSGKELIWEFGKRLENEKNGKDSMLYGAWKNKVPVFVPGMFDGAFGCQLWMFYQEHRNFKVNIFEDEQSISDLVFDAKKSGALMIGGGISKHHLIWWNQFKGGLDYAVYITTAQEYDGSLSGARIKEGISWGKVKENAKYVTIDGDATIILPLMIGALIERLE